MCERWILCYNPVGHGYCEGTQQTGKVGDQVYGGGKCWHFFTRLRGTLFSKRQSPTNFICFHTSSKSILIISSYKSLRHTFFFTGSVLFILFRNCLLTGGGGWFKNRILKGICGAETKEVAGCWRKLLSERFPVLYFLNTTIRMMTSRAKGSEGHAARKGSKR